MRGFYQLLRTVPQRAATMRQSEGRFRQFFEKNSSVLLLIEPESGAIINANQAAVAFYGFPQDQLIGMSIKHINTLAPELRDAEIADVPFYGGAGGMQCEAP